MKKHIITGVICGGIGLLAGYKIATSNVRNLLNSEEFKNGIIKGFEDTMSEYRESKNKYQDIIFDTRTDGMKIIDSLNDTIDNYGFASIADLYDISGLTSKFTDNEYGWTDVSTAEVVFNKNGYILNMPKPTKLK